MKLTPFAALEYARLRSGGYTETSTIVGANTPGVLALAVTGRTTTSIPAFIGARLSGSYLMDNGWTFAPSATLAYVHEFSTRRNLNASFVSLQGSNFTASGSRPAANGAQARLGVDFTSVNGVKLFAEFQADVSSSARNYAGRGGVKLAW